MDVIYHSYPGEMQHEKKWAKTNENEIKIYKNQIQLLDIYITLLPHGCILCQAKWLYSF